MEDNFARMHVKLDLCSKEDENEKKKKLNKFTALVRRAKCFNLNADTILTFE
jgi:hypothetical protein